MSKLVELVDSLKGLRHGKGATPEMIEFKMKEMNVTFADEYISLLQKYGIVSIEGHEIVGISSSPRLDVMKATSRGRELNTHVSDDMYVIEDCCIDGILIWQNANGEIFQTIMNSPTEKIFNSLLEYFKSLNE